MLICAIPPAKYLSECVSYDPQTGAFVWLQRPLQHFRTARLCNIWNTKYAGSLAFDTNNGNGYRVSCLDRKIYMAHRIAWVLIHGTISNQLQVDHINGDRSDNRLNNLRLVDCQTNHRNAAMPRTNTSGVVGVYYCKPKRRWKAQCSINNRSVHIGYYQTREDAAVARRKYEREIGFHPNHGRTICS